MQIRDEIRYLSLLLPGILLLVLSTAAGCGGGTERVAVSGNVTVDGELLTKGQISFTPINGTTGPKAGGEIVEGRFEIEVTDGPVVGELRVEIWDEPEVSFDLDNPEAFSENVPDGVLPKSRVPSRYNSRSELTATTYASGSNEFQFDLRTR